MAGQLTTSGGLEELTTVVRSVVDRLRNARDDTAISIHIYGTDVTRIGSSVRRYYDQPVVAA